MDLLFKALGLTVVTSPAVLLAFLGIPSLLGRRLSEESISRCAQAAIWAGLLASVTVLGLMLITGTRHVLVVAENWVVIPHYHFAVKLMFDRLSVPFVILAYLLCGTIGAFATRYMHNESGFNRFFFLYSLFLLGIIVASLAGTIETLFAGWELVGLSSALLVAFYHERPAPVRNGLHVWTVYRISDAALLLAAVVLHRLTGEGDFDRLTTGDTYWPEGLSAIDRGGATLAGLLLVLAAAGKSAMIPFSGWLPRAMEGPTPSSAVFYGALSVHLGAFLLLRVSALLDAAPVVRFAVIVLGLSTAGLAALMGRVQTDIKSALSFASLTQVGLIFAEIGIGFRYLALIHILGHACWRTLQFLRAPTLLHDHKILENSLGKRVSTQGGWWEWLIPAPMQTRFYRFALERGNLDDWLSRYVVTPVQSLFLRCDRWERNVVERVDEVPLPSSDRSSSEWSSVLRERP